MYIINTRLKDGTLNGLQLEDYAVATKVFIDIVNQKVAARVEIWSRHTMKVVACWTNLDD